MTFLKIFLFLGFVLFAPAAATGADDLQKEKNMRIKLNFNNHDVIIRMEDNPAAEQMIKIAGRSKMEKRYLGKDKLEVSAVGLGCMGFTQSYPPFLPEEESIKVLRAAVDIGVTLLGIVRSLGGNRQKSACRMSGHGRAE